MCIFPKAPQLPQPATPDPTPVKPMINAEAKADNTAQARAAAQRGLRIDLTNTPASGGASGLNIPL